MKTPKFQLALVERPSRSVVDKGPRYDVCVNGNLAGDLYFNMRGYVGYLPTVTGARMNLGERGIGVFRKEVTALNREARAAISTAMESKDRILQVYETEDPDTLMVAHGDAEALADPDSAIGRSFIGRTDWEVARVIFGTDSLAMTWFDQMPAAAVTPLTEVSRSLEAPHPEDMVLAAVETEDPRTLLLVTGPCPLPRPVGHLKYLTPNQVEDNARSAQFISRRAWTHLTLLEGREILPVPALPSCGPMNRDAQFRPALKLGPERAWIGERFGQTDRDRVAEPEEGPGL